LFAVSTPVPTMPSRSADTLREVDALLTEDGAKAAAEPAKRERIAVVFMVVI